MLTVPIKAKVQHGLRKLMEGTMFLKLIQQALKPGQDKIKRSAYKATNAVFQFHYGMLQTH